MSVRFQQISICFDLGNLLDLVVAASARDALVPLVDSRITYADAMVISCDLILQ
jgi:hypothetical protein